jgi:hypothetical protein
MSRSYKKHAVTGISCAESDKSDKQSANRKLRHKIKQLVLKFEVIDFKINNLPKLREISSTWCFAKDGKHFYRKGHWYEQRAKRK